jgi:hypothetical protein
MMMRRRIFTKQLIFCLLYLLTLLQLKVSFAQYANDWIHPGQSYYKITVGRDAIYRLTHADLMNAGVPLATVDPRTLQLFHRGEEQAIYVEGEQDAVFNTADFLEFFGKRNDGTNDAALYPGNQQPHPYHNLYSDTAAYFLTWSFGLPGKRMATFSEINVNGTPKDLYHLDERLNVYTNEYSFGTSISGVIRLSAFDTGEGWTGSTICIGNTGCTGQQDFVIDNLTGTVFTSGNPLVEVLLVGRDQLSHQTQILAGPSSSSLRVIGTQTFLNFDTHKIVFALNGSDVASDGRVTIRVVAQGVGGGRDRVSVSYIKINYPQNFESASVTEKSFHTAPKSANKSYLEWENASAGARVWDVTDANFVTRIGTTVQGSTLRAMVNNTTFTRRLWYATLTQTPKIKKVSFRNLSTLAADYLIVTHRLLNDGARAYAGYRSTTAGGGYDTLVVNIDEVFNQFNYGESSSRALYEFARWAVGTGNPRYFFIIGKGRDVGAGFYRKTTLNPGELPEMVPTAGIPASDMLFSANLNGSGHAPAIPTGRLSVTTSAQVFSYLAKIQEHESQPLNQLWRKQGLHLSGGIESGELVAFRQFMDGFKGIAENEFWGGRISTIAKREANPVELVNVSDKVNEGVNLITFFGHSSSATIDIDIGFVSNATLGYNNPGKYPVFLVNGCNAGNFFASGTLFGEDWMQAPNKGARAFIAHSSFGFSSTLKAYSDLFYSIALGDSVFLRKGLGDVQKEVATRYLQLFSNDRISISQVQQMILLGDPAVSLFGTNKSDYVLPEGSIKIESINNEPLTARSDSLMVKVVVQNLGAFRGGLINLRLVRTLNNNQQLVYNQLINPVLLQDTIVFKIDNDLITASGSNQFTAIIDPDNLLAELSEANNSSSVNLFLPFSGTKNLFPADHAIVQQTQVQLVWQITDPLADTRSFDLQVDTTAQFNSPFFQSHAVSGKVIAKHALTLLTRDSTVYYWRTRLNNPQPEESPEWELNSFVYITGSSEGWGQVQFGQWYDNVLSGLVKNETTRQLSYLEKTADLFVRTYGSANPTPRTNVSVQINSVEYNLATQGQPCRDNTINIIAFSRTSLVPYPGLPFNFQDPRTCGREPQVINSFGLSEVQTGLGNDLSAVIDNIEAGDSVLLFSIGDPGYASWNGTLLSKLAQLGISSSTISSLQSGEPIIIMGRKDSPAGTATVYRSATPPANQQLLAISESVTASNTSGTMRSSRIGPAIAWQSLRWKTSGKQPSDMVRVNIYGSSLTGTESLILSHVSVATDLSGIDAHVYPYLRLEVELTDNINLTPAMLDHWVVTYIGVPEGILLPGAEESLLTLQEGESWKSQLIFENISSRSFADSLSVRSEIFNTTKGTTAVFHKKIKAPAPGQQTAFEVDSPTVGLAGVNNLTVMVNPFVLPELYYENNVLARPGHLTIQRDKTPPVLRVTFDGRTLINGDWVSANPLIEMELLDENPFLLKSDTLGFTILLKSPCDTDDCPFHQIYFKRNDIHWSPATATAPFQVRFTPVDLPPGSYTLQVNSQDPSGNPSGTGPYEISFVVSSEEAVSLRSVSPNPSSALFFFEMVVLGTNTGDGKLEIFHSDGRPVFQSSLRDLLHVGTNRFSWAGVSTEGTDLSNGMYIYRLMVVQAGKTYTFSGRLVLAR